MKLITPTQASQILSVTPETLREWVKKGNLRAIKTPGGRYRYHQSDIEALAHESRTELQEEPPDVPVLDDFYRLLTPTQISRMSKGNLQSCVVQILAYLNARDSGYQKQLFYDLEEIEEEHRLTMEELEKKLAITQAALIQVVGEKSELEKQTKEQQEVIDAQKKLINKQQEVIDFQNSSQEKFEARMVEQVKELSAKIAIFEEEKKSNTRPNQQNPSKPLNRSKNQSIGKSKPNKPKAKGFGV